MQGLGFGSKRGSLFFRGTACVIQDWSDATVESTCDSASPPQTNHVTIERSDDGMRTSWNLLEEQEDISVMSEHHINSDTYGAPRVTSYSCASDDATPFWANTSFTVTGSQFCSPMGERVTIEGENFASNSSVVTVTSEVRRAEPHLLFAILLMWRGVLKCVVLESRPSMLPI